MIIIRRAFNQDLDAIHHLTLTSGIGITTLPKNKQLLQDRLQWSDHSFDSALTPLAHGYYLFLAQDSKTGQIVGTSAIDSCTGYKEPFYSFKLTNTTHISKQLSVRNELQWLHLVMDYQYKSELCTLYLAPDFRVNANGLLLSRARFLYMATFPACFRETTIAELRGVSDEQGYSPFWHYVGSKFFPLSFQEADKLTLIDKQFIADLMPFYPICVQLLPPKAQAVIGKPHAASAAAMKILMKEGFSYQNYLDIFDAGPALETSTSTIKTLKESKLYQVVAIHATITSKRYIIATTSTNFQALVGYTLLNEQELTCVLDQDSAEALQVQPGNILRITAL